MSRRVAAIMRARAASIQYVHALLYFTLLPAARLGVSTGACGVPLSERGVCRMQRLLPLQGGRNFRDLGGYATIDGRRLKWRRLFRSGVMTYLTAEDQAYLDGLSVRMICDLRTAAERLREPTHWGEGRINRLLWDYDRRRVSLRGLIEGSGFSAPQARNAMLKLYRMIPQGFAEQYAAVFANLAASALPLVFNCSAGKDRTGVLAALILTSLGVPRDQVLADYTLTDTAIDLERELFEHPDGSIGLGDEYTFLMTVSSSERRPLFISSPDYLQSAFDQIDADHGSIDNYLHTTLRVTPAAQSKIRETLLES
jgi:protein-tyrosine phosphatase